MFSWSPACAVALLLVEGPDGDTWDIRTDDGTWSDPDAANQISPPITYGTSTLSAGVMTNYGPEGLVPGSAYDLILFQIVDPTTSACPDLVGNGCRLVIHEFTR